MRKLIFIPLAFTFMLYSCTSKKAIIRVNKIPKEGVVINKWQIIGPITVDKTKSESCLVEDQLKLSGLNELNITHNDFLGLSKKRINPDTVSHTQNFCSVFVNTGDIPLEILDGNYSEFKEQYGIFYATCLIKCNKQINTMLHVGCGLKNKIWLNNQLLSTNSYALPAWSYQNYIPIALEKGENLLMIKMYKSDKQWELYARFENFTNRGLKRNYESRNHLFLKNCVLNDYNLLEFGPTFPPSEGEITVSNNDGKDVFSDSINKSDTWSGNLASLDNGHYLATYNSHDIVLKQGFYKGDLADTTKMLFNVLHKIQKTEKTSRNIAALEYRYNHLLKQSWINWKKVVQIFEETQQAYSLLLKEKDPFHHVSGCFLRSYISKIDDSEQYYNLHVPSTYRMNNPSSVMIVIPTNGGKLPYLESFRIANYSLINTFQDLAEKYNMIVVEPGSRHLDKVIHNTLEEYEIFDILTDVGTDYTLDSSRQYLSSACSGGNDALKLAVKYPDRFAALGLISPSINHESNIDNSYLQYNAPVNFLENIIGLSFMDIHSRIDRHVSFKVSRLLEKKARKVNMKNFTINILPSEFQYYYTDAFFDDIFKFTQNYTLNRSPEEVDFTTSQMLYNKSFWVTITNMLIPSDAHIQAKMNGNKLIIKKENIYAYNIDLTTLPHNRKKALKVIDNGQIVFKGIATDSVLRIGKQPKPGVTMKNNHIAGPLAHVFSQRFILVKGSSGSQSEIKGISALADTINKYWNERYFTNCIVKNDFEITEKDIETSSLVLLGNAGSNSFLNKIQKEIPLMVSTSNVKIGNKTTEGDKLCFYLVYPNPLNKNKYVAVIGYNNPDFISLGSETGVLFNDVSNYGWYDYKVWNNLPFRNDELSGYFNSSWE